MMPLKFEFFENCGGSYDVTVLGVGEAGREVVRKYPCHSYRDAGDARMRFVAF